MENAQDFQVKDIKEAQFGRKEIELAEVEMPGLMKTREKYGKTKPLKDARVSGSLHMTIQTAVLIETLEELGAKVRWCSCNIFSTQDHAAAAIAAAGKSAVFAWKNETLEEYWECTMKALRWGDKGPTSIVDDGGDMTLILIEGAKWGKLYKEKGQLPNIEEQTSDDARALYRTITQEIKKDPMIFVKLAADLKGVSEETTTGVMRLGQLAQSKQLPFVAINVNDSVTKSKFDNIYGCRHSVIDGILRATDVLISGKKVLVCGYGDVGKGCAQAFKANNAVVYISEVDPICALQACMEGFRVVKIDKVVHEIDIFVSATGNKDIIRVEHMKKMKKNAIVGNIGHFDNEVDMKGLYGFPGIERINIKPQTDLFRFPGGTQIIILAEGRLLNLGCATGHPSFVMSNSFTNQVIAQISLYDQKNGYQPGNVYVLPKKLDEEVARLHLDAFGAELEDLNEDQAGYIGVPVCGPYKKDTYRY